MKFYLASELMELLRIKSKTTLWARVKRKQLPPPIAGSRRPALWDREEIHKFLKTGELDVT